MDDWKTFYLKFKKSWDKKTPHTKDKHVTVEYKRNLLEEKMGDMLRGLS
jgi:hypothetical protein